MKIRDFLERTILEFTFVRRVCLAKHATRQQFQTLVAILMADAGKLFRVTHDLTANGLILYPHGWVGFLPIRKIVVETNQQGEIFISNHPNSMTQAFSIFLVFFIALYELMAVVKSFACYFQGNCQNFIVMAVVVLGPIPVFAGARFVNWLLFIQSRSLYEAVIARSENVLAG